MKCVISGARSEPYEFKDQSGQVMKGVSGVIQGIKASVSKTKGFVGYESFAMKCDPDVAAEVRNELLSANGPVYADADVDTKGTGENAKIIVNGVEVLGALENFAFSLKQASGLVPLNRAAPPAAAARSAPARQQAPVAQ